MPAAPQYPPDCDVYISGPYWKKLLCMLQRRPSVDLCTYGIAESEDLYLSHARELGKTLTPRQTIGYL